MMKKRITLSLRCEYSDLELAEKRDELSTVICRQGEVEQRKAAVNREFKEELDGLYSRASELAHQIKARGQDRPVECVTEFHKPNIGEKTVIRLDTGEMVRVEVMTDEERQDKIDFGLEENRMVQGLIDSVSPIDTPPPHPPAPPPDDRPEEGAAGAGAA
jgi:hypothetical protein